MGQIPTSESLMISNWIEASRPRTLPLAVSTVGLGGVLALHYNKFNVSIFLLTVLTTILLQVLSNFANDYGDFQNGADLKGRTGPRRAVAAGLVSRAGMLRAIILFAVLALISGVSLLFIAFGEDYKGLLTFLGIGLVSIAAAVTYTAGKNPYGYKGYGDFSVFLFFGFVGVLGSSYLYLKELKAISYEGAIMLGSLSTAVLNLNNMRDLRSDSLAGKNTIPVKLGIERAKIYHLFLLALGGFTYFSLGSALVQFPYFLISGIGAWTFLVLQAKKVTKAKAHQDFDSGLKPLALGTLLMVLLLFGFSYFFPV